MPEFPIPADDIKKMLGTGNDLFCAECAKPITGEGYAFLGNDEAYCKPCGKEFLAETKVAAEAFAFANCQITSPIPACDPIRARHDLTNYDELVNSLDTTNELNALYWFAIRDRMDELVNEAIEEASGVDWDAER